VKPNFLQKDFQTSTLEKKRKKKEKKKEEKKEEEPNLLLIFMSPIRDGNGAGRVRVL